MTRRKEIAAKLRHEIMKLVADRATQQLDIIDNIPDAEPRRETCGCKCHDDGSNCRLLHPDQHKPSSEREVEEKIKEIIFKYQGACLETDGKYHHHASAQEQALRELVEVCRRER